MTIDMHRDTSLRESAAYALFDSRTARLKPPSSSGLSSYTATRNLPDDNPAHAVKTMEETCLPPAKLRPQQKQRPRRRTSKPALCYTVYWEADYDPQTELSRIDDSLTALFGTHLQTLIVGRSEYPRRTHVILNVIDPSTHRLGIVEFPYFELMCWHLTTICDDHAIEALNRGKAATTADSLRRQDHRLLDLPPLFAEAVRGVPGYHFDSNTLHMVWRAGPSTFHTADSSIPSTPTSTMTNPKLAALAALPWNPMPSTSSSIGSAILAARSFLATSSTIRSNTMHRSRQTCFTTWTAPSPTPSIAPFSSCTP